MLKYLALASALLCALTINAEARQRHKQWNHNGITLLAHPDCNGTGSNAMPCEGVAPSARGERIAKQLGFGAAQKVYTPLAATISVTPTKWSRATSVYRHRNNISHLGGSLKTEASSVQRMTGVTSAIVSHPPGCPSRAFCGCGAAVRIFGAPIRSLWLAANWFKFPRTAPAPGAVAVRRHHVFVLEADLGGGVWRVYDANSGRHQTRIHARSIAGYVIVNPRAG